MFRRILNKLKEIDQLVNKIGQIDTTSIYVRAPLEKFGKPIVNLPFSWINHGIANSESSLMAIFSVRDQKSMDEILKKQIFELLDELKFKFKLFEEISQESFKKYKITDAGTKDSPVPYPQFTIYILNIVFNNKPDSQLKFQKFKILVKDIQKVIFDLEVLIKENIK